MKGSKIDKDQVPSYKRNVWNKKRKNDPEVNDKRTNETPITKDVEKSAWEAEQKRLDREWYGLDEGYDETHNPFSGISEEYTKKKEEQMEAKQKRRMTAKQAQKISSVPKFHKLSIVFNVEHVL